MRRTSLALLFLALLSLSENKLLAQTVSFDDAREKWRLATTYMREGAPRKALPLLEYLTSIAPANTEVRLELALAYFKIEDNAKARFHFEQTLDSNLEGNKRKLVLQYLRAIENRREWNASLSFAIVPESNAANRTSSETINLGGLDFVLNEVPEPGVGANINARLSYSSAISRDLSAKFSIVAYGTVFKDTLWDDYSVRGEAALIHRSDLDRELSYGAFLTHRWLSDRPFSSDFGVFASLAKRVGSDTRVFIRGEVAQRETFSLPGRDGHVYSLNATATKVLSPQLSVQVKGFIVDTEVAADFESGQLIGIGLGATKLFSGGWRVSANTIFSQDRRSGDAPVFNVARRENQFNLKLQLLNRRIQFQGFTPTFEIGHDRRQSNISLYSFENSYLSVGVTREF